MKYKDIELPDGLNELTVDFMKNIIDTFIEENKLHKLDALSLYILAGNVDIYLKCDEDIRLNGLTRVSDRGNASLSPYVIEMKQVQNSILSLLKEFGLTLGSRTKIKVIDDGGENPLLDFLKK